MLGAVNATDPSSGTYTLTFAEVSATTEIFLFWRLSHTGHGGAFAQGEKRSAVSHTPCCVYIDSTAMMVHIIHNASHGFDCVIE